MFGKTYVYSVKAPKGWVLDNGAGIPDRIRSVFYKQGESWKDGEVTAYTKAIILNENVKTIDTIVKSYVNRAKSEGLDDYQVEKAYDVVADLGAKGEVYYFASKAEGTVEAICFFPEKKTVNKVIMKAGSKEGLVENINAFRQLCESYYFVGDDGNREAVQKAFKEMKEKEQAIVNKRIQKEVAELKAAHEEEVRKQKEKTERIINSFFGTKD